MRTKVLDHGYLELIERWGSDERIVEAARMSTDKGFKGWGRGPLYRCPKCSWNHYASYSTDSATCSGGHVSPAHEEVEMTPVESRTVGDEKLLAYLYSHKHMTPFEMAGMTIEVQAPIFVFREWHRHRTQSYNELSARYTPLPDVNYVPTVDRILQRSGTNKQAQSTGALVDEKGAEDFRQALSDHYAVAEALYRLSLGAAGIPKELARLCIPVGRYSRMRASANLRNWMAFLTLRMDENAQWEIRQYANEVAKLIEAELPRTYELFANGA